MHKSLLYTSAISRRRLIVDLVAAAAGVLQRSCVSIWFEIGSFDKVRLVV